jgi:hypothetical protein
MALLDSVLGLLIHAASGKGGGSGRPQTNRSGCVSYAEANSISFLVIPVNGIFFFLPALATLN